MRNLREQLFSLVAGAGLLLAVISVRAALGLISLGIWWPILIGLGIAAVAVALIWLCYDGLRLVGRLVHHARGRNDIYASDNFKRHSQVGWGKASGGKTWRAVTTRSNLWIDRQGFGVLGFSGDPSLSQWVEYGKCAIADCDATVRFSIPASAVNGARPTVGLFVRLQRDHWHYLARYNDARARVEFMVGPHGSRNYLDRAGFPFVVSPGSAYFLRMAVMGSRVFVQAWPEGEERPTTWGWQGEPSRTLPPGGIGLYGYAVEGGPEVRFHDYKVGAFTVSADEILRGADRVG